MGRSMLRPYAEGLVLMRASCGDDAAILRGAGYAIEVLVRITGDP